MSEDYGLKISDSGVSAPSATGESITFTSGRNSLKFPEWLTQTITITGGIGTLTVAHGQPFKPVAIAFIVVSSSVYYMPTYAAGGTSDYYVDGTNLVVTVNAPFSADGTQFPIYYVISETETAE